MDAPVDTLVAARRRGGFRADAPLWSPGTGTGPGTASGRLRLEVLAHWQHQSRPAPVQKLTTTTASVLGQPQGLGPPWATSPPPTPSRPSSSAIRQRIRTATPLPLCARCQCDIPCHIRYSYALVSSSQYPSSPHTFSSNASLHHARFWIIQMETSCVFSESATAVKTRGVLLKSTALLSSGRISSDAPLLGVHPQRHLRR